MKSARERVFDTPELLELILLKAPLKTALLAQRVSKKWQLMIEESTKLQRSLFFEPAECGDLEYSSKGKLFAAACATWTHTNSGADEVEGWKLKQGGKSYQVFFNPLFHEYYTKICTKDGSSGRVRDNLSVAWSHPGASWRRMVLTQPAVSATWLIILTLGFTFNTGDVKLGDVVEALDTGIQYSKTYIGYYNVEGDHLWAIPKSGEELNTAGYV